MKRIEQYGLQWIVSLEFDENDKERVFLKQNGLIFSGGFDISLFWGPHIYINKMYLQENFTKRTPYNLPPQRFFSKELEPLCHQADRTNPLHWYNTLWNGFAFSKKAFKKDRRSDFWKMSLTAAIGSAKEAEHVVYLFIVDYLIARDSHKDVYRMRVDSSNNYPFLYVEDEIYEQLPQIWTIQDLYNINKDDYEPYKKQQEQLWYNIAEARTQHKPVEITVYDKANKPVIYTERIVYGVPLPTIVTQKQQQEEKER